MDRRRLRFDSSIATKILIGVTGLSLILYLFIHVAGNLVVFLGPAAYNTYAFTLESNVLLPVVELALLLLFVVHIYQTVRMYLANQKARPVRYAVKKRAGSPSRKTVASTTMILSGLWLLVFLIIHVRAFHEGWGREYAWAAGGRDLYRQEMETFQSPAIVAFYVLSMVVVGSHLWHGIISSFQSLGIDLVRWSPRALTVGRVLAVLIAATFAFIVIWAHATGGTR
jgi:succinate dehydrogenase / fumarate reductase cytochrome b subunit